MRHQTLLFLGCVLWVNATTAQADEPYTQHENIVYSEAYGIGLVMDIFVPTGEKNGLGIVDVVSGAWHSDRSKIQQHKMAQMYDIFCRRGYTVFGVRPGSITKFTGLQMTENVQSGIRWVKQHADEYDVDPERLGMTGASAGGHLACMTAVKSQDGESAVKSVAVFFPPTDLVTYTRKKMAEPPKKPKDGDKSEIPLPIRMGALCFDRFVTVPTEEQLFEGLASVSPALMVTGKEPPFLLIHGDADELVPLEQSEIMVAALKAHDVPVELIVKPGGGHPWPTIHEEVKVIADWMDKQLNSDSATAVGN